MIRYAISEAELKQHIKAQDPDWLTKADRQTDAFEKAGKYLDHTTFWRNIKPVFMRLQHNKCGYCERVLAGGDEGKIEHDVEHYRPKNAVNAWPTRKIIKARKLDYPGAIDTKTSVGYFLLAYKYWNYLATCKICNSTYKGNYFPIDGPRALGTTSRAALKAERPYLIYPLGNRDPDPEKVITFFGYVAMPMPKSGFNKKRAQVTIDLFDLNREQMALLRAQQLRRLVVAIQLLESDPASKDLAMDEIDYLLGPGAAFTSCARAFYRLYEQNRQQWLDLKKDIVDYLRESTR